MAVRTGSQYVDRTGGAVGDLSHPSRLSETLPRSHRGPPGGIGSPVIAAPRYRPRMTTNEFEMDFSARVREAQAIVAETAKCSPEDALELMTSTANLEYESLDQVADEVLSGRLHFDPPE